MIVVNDGQSTDTSYPANTATWAERDTDRYIRLETNGTISGEDAGNLADVYVFSSGAWEKYDWDVFDAETIRSEMLPFAAEAFKVVFTNGLEWVITKEPVEQGIASMNIDLPTNSSAIIGGKISLKESSTYQDVAQHLRATVSFPNEEIALLEVAQVDGNWCFTDGDNTYNEINLDGAVLTFIDDGTASCEYQSFEWV